MAIKYDARLYKKIKEFEINEIVLTHSKKGVKHVITITNITELSWEHLQLLVLGGGDRFSKMVFLYEKYKNINTSESLEFRGKTLDHKEVEEITKYIEIYKNNSFIKHTEVNHYISENNIWGSFPVIRSLNDHGTHSEIPGIEPQYFSIICQILNISGEGGMPLDSYKKY